MAARRRWAALAAWAAATFALAYPTGPHPFPITLALCLGALLCLERPVLAGVLTGAAGFWRLEFAAYLALGVLLAYAVKGQSGRAAARYAAAAVGTAALVFAPFVIAAGPGDAFELLIRYPLLDFSDYQSLPFPLSYDGPLNTGSPWGFLSDSAESLLLFYLPLALVMGLLAALVAGALRFTRAEWWRLAVAVFALGMAHYLLARTDLFHTGPLAVMVAVLAAWVAPALHRPWASIAAVSAALACAALAYAVVEGADRAWLLARAGGTRPRSAGRRRCPGAGRRGTRARGDGRRDPGPRPARRADLRPAAAIRSRHGGQSAALRARGPPEPDAL